MKSGKNVVIEYSTGAFELAKTELAKIFTSDTFRRLYAVQVQVGLEQTDAIVDQCHRIYNRRANGMLLTFFKPPTQ